jgi:alginate O-acetyltransferase complex protein AlgJ
VTSVVQPIGPPPPPPPPPPPVGEPSLPRTARAAPSATWSKLLTITFLAALVVPNLDLAFGLDPNPSPLKEQVPFPPLLHRRESIRHLPGELLYYLKSNMGFRGSLVRARGLIAWRGLGVSSAPLEVVRADPWLLFRDERVFDDFRRVDRFSSAQLDRWATVLEDRRTWLARRGIHFLVVIAPNKETVYAEVVPPAFTREPATSRLMQLSERLRGSTAVDFLDLSSELLARKGDGRLYHLTDTHWCDLGAFAGYRAITARLVPWFPHLRPLGDADVEREAAVTRGGDLARVAGLQDDLVEPQVQLRVRPPRSDRATFADGTPLTFQRLDVVLREHLVTHASDGEIPSAVLIRDSFGEALMPYLAEHFQRADWVWAYDFPAELIERVHPSLVIEQLVERKLMVIDPVNPPAVEREAHPRP